MQSRSPDLAKVRERAARKALRALERASLAAAADGAPDLSEWEQTFLAEVKGRVETFGSAFRDLSKGGAGEALSTLQTRKVKEITRKTKGEEEPQRAKRGFGGRGMRRAERD
jgi:hypothetical protein